MICILNYIDKEIYSDLSHAILLLSDDYGFDVFDYVDAESRLAGVMRLRVRIETVDDGIERDLVFATNGELSHVGAWDGHSWTDFDLPFQEPR